MITTLKNNKRERTSAFDKLKNTSKISGKLQFNKKASKRQLADIKDKLQQENKIALIRKSLFFIFIFCILLYFFAFHKY